MSFVKWYETIGLTLSKLNDIDLYVKKLEYRFVEWTGTCDDQGVEGLVHLRFQDSETEILSCQLDEHVDYEQETFEKVVVDDNEMGRLECNKQNCQEQIHEYFEFRWTLQGCQSIGSRHRFENFS